MRLIPQNNNQNQSHQNHFQQNQDQSIESNDRYSLYDYQTFNQNVNQSTFQLPNDSSNIRNYQSHLKNYQQRPSSVFGDANVYNQNQNILNNSKELCNMTLDQSLQQDGEPVRRREPNVMHENVKVLKTQPSPVRSNTETPKHQLSTLNKSPNVSAKKFDIAQASAQNLRGQNNFTNNSNSILNNLSYRNLIQQSSNKAQTAPFDYRAQMFREQEHSQLQNQMHTSIRQDVMMTSGQSSIKRELESSDASSQSSQQILRAYRGQNSSSSGQNKQSNIENQMMSSQPISEFNQQRHQQQDYVVHQSILNDFDNDEDFNLQAREFEQLLISQLKMRGSSISQQVQQNNQGAQLEQKFSKALRKYIKKEIHLALLSTQRVQKSTNNLSDLTLDSLLGKQATKDKFSCSSSLNYNQDNSIEEEILKEISTNLATKMDGLKVLFGEMENKLNSLQGNSPKKNQNQNQMSYAIEQQMNRRSNNYLDQQLLDHHNHPIDQQPFFSNSTEQDGYNSLIQFDKLKDAQRDGKLIEEYLSQQSANHVVNASDLDQWVKKADEYRELYIKTEMQLQMQRMKYEEHLKQIVNDYNEQCQQIKGSINSAVCQDCNILSQLVGTLQTNNADLLQKFPLNQGILLMSNKDSRKQNWLIVIQELLKIPDLQQQLHEHMLQVQELQLNLEQTQIQMHGLTLGMGLNHGMGGGLGMSSQNLSGQGGLGTRSLIQQVRVSGDQDNVIFKGGSISQRSLLRGSQICSFSDHSQSQRNLDQDSSNYQQVYETKIKQLENELKFLRDEKETQDLEIRHLKLVNNSNSQSQRSLLSHQNMNKSGKV
ncbi:UNKNOWN [Stylonychia lemnae]|uniref:Uncharacterized protein n=1 Tax=Stylonychia lemnae TaxID=5949 RepID=A0A078A470_STYLE|nr:UNKNOWN [Stylonychia lemnae]|eukprot:CDW75549.1 UNKNOWN [Stylonychia lemnae]